MSVCTLVLGNGRKKLWGVVDQSLVVNDDDSFTGAQGGKRE